MYYQTIKLGRGQTGRDFNYEVLFEKKTTSTGKLTLEKYVAVFKLRKTFFFLFITQLY